MALTINIYNGGANPLSLTAKNGIVYRDEYNETRDSATIVVRSKAHLDVEPFDFAIVSGTVRGVAIANKPMVVDSVSEEQIGFGDNPVYDTTINLFSETKELERVTLPNLAITKHADGTGKTVIQAIEDYLFQYAPRIKVTDGNSFRYEQKWNISQQVSDRFSSVDCPEFQWNRPTLSEVLTDLMQVEDCIPVIKNHELGLIDLRERKGEADDSNFVRVVRSMTSNDYNQNLEVNMQNAISSRPARMVEYVSGRNETQGILTTDNIQVVTQKPIYEIKKLTAIVYAERYDPDFDAMFDSYCELDITDCVKEKAAYDVLSPVGIVTAVQSQAFEDAKKTHQCANVYFTRGGNVIDGWGKVFDFPLGFQQTVISYIIKHTMYASYAVVGDIRDVMFKVEYLTQGEMNVKAGKTLPLRNCETAAFDNQGSSYVDIRQQSIFEYAKANRLANRIMEINGTCFADADVPALGKTYNGAVIFSREIQYFDDCIRFHLLATENYVLSNYFTSIRSRARSWAIASGKEALTRHDNAKVYAEFSLDPRSDETMLDNKEILFDVSAYHYDFGPEVILSGLYHFYNDETIKFAALISEDENGNQYPSVGNAYGIDCQVSATGLSLSMTATLADNYQVGIKVEIEDSRYVNHLLPYADGNGEFVNAVVAFASFIDPAGGDFVWGGYTIDANTHEIVAAYPWVYSHHGSGTPQDAAYENARKEKGRAKPVINSPYLIAPSVVVNTQTLKDNRETFALTAQIEYCSDNSRIIVKKALVENHHFINGEQEDYSGLRILASSEIKTLAGLPTASADFVYAGFLVMSGGTLSYYSSADDGNNGYEWVSSPLATRERFAIMDGYLESQNSNSGKNEKNTATRVIVARANSDKTAIQYFEPAFRLFTLNRALWEEEDDVPGDASVTLNPNTVSVTKYADNCYRVYNSAGASAACWGLSDKNGKVLFAVNKAGGNNATEIFVNLSMTRDKAIRRSVALQHVVDSNL